MTLFPKDFIFILKVVCMRMLMCAHKYLCATEAKGIRPPETEFCVLAEYTGPVRVLGIGLRFSERAVCALNC